MPLVVGPRWPDCANAQKEQQSTQTWTVDNLISTSNSLLIGIIASLASNQVAPKARNGAPEFKQLVSGWDNGKNRRV